MSQPLDTDLARTLADKGVLTIRDAHIGTGLSISGLVDWAKLAVHQSGTDHPDVVVMFLGANEGFPMRHDGHDVRCCSGDWGAEYATRARGMTSTCLDGGARRIVWLALPAPRDPRRQRISHLVNAAVRLAAAPFGVQVQVLPTDAVFTPGGHYRDEMTVGGQQRIVRQPDGIHLNNDGAKLAAQLTVAALRTSFRVG
jgi:hypothetical protein